MLAGGVERVRRPVEHQQTGGGDGAGVVFRDPAGIFAFDDHAVHPGLEVAAHGVEDGFLGAAHGGKHGSPVSGDECGIGRGDCACLQHAVQYNHLRRGRHLRSGGCSREARTGVLLPALAQGIKRKNGARSVIRVGEGKRRMILKCALRLIQHCRSTLRCSSPGMRLAVGLSGGADSVALLRAGGAQRRSWDWCSMPRICTTGCAAPRRTAIWNSAARWRQSLDCLSRGARGYGCRGQGRWGNRKAGGVD
jgi:hypothetical protein